MNTELSIPGRMRTALAAAPIRVSCAPAQRAWVVLLMGMSFALSSTCGTALAKPEEAKEGSKKSKFAVPPAEEVAAQPTVHDHPSPKIVVDEPVHDFGETWMGPKLTHTFVIKNQGPVALLIESVKPSCGCTKAGEHPVIIQPGDSGDFPFAINSNKLRGRYEKTVSIATNDPVTPEIKLRLRGVCNRYVDVVPTNANFGKVAFDEPHERVLKLTNNTDNPVQLSLQKTEADVFKFELVEITPGKNFELHVSIEPPYEPGRHRFDNVVLTNVDEQKEIRVVAAATIPDRLDIQPPEVTLNTIKSNSAYTRPIRFYNYGKTEVKVLEATCDDPAIAVEVKERSAGKNYVISLNIPEGYMPPPQGRTITLRTDDAERPVIEIPLNAPQKTVAAEPQKRPAEEMVGKPAPQFELATTAGKSLDSEDLKDNVTVLDFFAPNCGFCGKQIPRLEEVRKQYEGKGVRFVAVSQTMRKRFSDDDVKAKINGLGFKGELAIDHENTVGPLFKANSYPTMVIIGESGNVDAVNIGNVGDLETRLKVQLDALLAGKAIPAIASDTPTPTDNKPAPQRPTQKLIGKLAPSFSFETMKGTKVSSANLADHPATVLNFVAPNCGFCKKQVPRLEELRQTYEAKGVKFFNVSQTMRKQYTAEETAAIFDNAGSKIELAYDPENAVGQAFSARSYPTMVVLGKGGKVEAVNSGNVGDLESRVKGQLDALIEGKPVPAVAQAAAPPQPTTPPAPPQRKRAADMIGQAAPAFTFETSDGKKLSNAQLASAPATVLNFVAPNCGFCKKQVPRLSKIREEYEAKGVRFINVAQTMRQKFTPEDSAKVFSDAGSTLEFAYDGDNTVGQAFGASGFPTMVVLGKSGKIEAVNVGNMGNLEEQMKGQLDALVEGKAIPQQYVAKAPAPQPAQTKTAADMIGQPAPSFAFETSGGKKVSNAELAGAPAVVLNFVAPNCGFCKKQVPRLDKIREEYESKGVRFINVAQTMRTKFAPEDAAKVFSDLNTSIEFAYDGDNRVGGAFGTRGFPTMVVLGKSGKVEAVNVGNMGDLETKMKGQLDALVAGKSIPQEYIAKAPTQRRRPAEDMVGKPAPEFALKTLAGKPVGNGEFPKYKATVLNFVAPNCGFCKKQLPAVEAIRKQYEEKGVRFVNVAQKMRTAFSVEETTKVFEGAGSNLELATDFTNEVGGKFQATSYPTMMVVGADGKIQHVNIGAKQDLDTLLKGQLDALLK